MKVYITTLSRISDGEDLGSDYPKAFYNKEDAIEDMYKFIHGEGNEYNLCIKDNI